MSLLELDGVHVRRGRRDVVRDVDLRLERGEVTAVLGPNGAGKSSLLEAVGGVVPVSQGQVRREGRVATVLQTPGLARRSVRANVELALAWWGVPRRQRRVRALEALETMRADHLAGRAAGRLSGGERRRVHVARGLALRPDLLLLDEPFAGLDPQTRGALCEDTASALRSTESGVLVVVHDRAEAWALADRLVVMVEGRVVAQGAPHALLAAPPTAEVARFLGYDGELATDEGVVLTRPPHVRVGPDGAEAGEVVSVVPREDGLRVEIASPRGRVRAVVDPPVAVGDRLRFDVVGGARFPGPPHEPQRVPPGVSPRERPGPEAVA